MNKKQMRAIARLEKAMKACSDARLYLYVASGTLLAYDARAIDRYERDGKGDQHDAMTVLQDDAVFINDFDTRIDGGDF